MIFGKRIIRKRMQREAAKRVETGDSLLWDVSPSQKTCRIIIQGHDDPVHARYPENTRQTPTWMKPGAAVRFMHVGGNRNKVEIVGPGLVTPTPAEGGVYTPALATGENAILTGCQISALSGMTVRIATGTYRINDVVHTLDAAGVVMTAGSTIVMTAGSPLYMGASAGVLPISVASSTETRMDAFFVGIDGVIDYVTGTPSATNPQIPDTPATHILLGWVMVPPGTTEITQSMIDYPFVEPFVSQLSAVAALDRLTWADGSTTIQLDVLDQYGNAIIGTNWHITASLITGTGTITSGKTTGTSASTATFTYTREADYDTDVEVVESCPIIIEFVLNQNIGITMLCALTLEDISGGLIFG